VHLPRKENARSCHQRLFEENVRKTKSGSTNFKYERFRSCFYSRGMYYTPRVCHKGRQPLIECANHDFKIMYFPFLYFFMYFLAFYVFLLFVVDKGVSLAPKYSSIAMKKSDLRSSLGTKRWLNCFYLFLQDRF